VQTAASRTTIGWSGAGAALVNPFPDNVTSGMRIALFLFVATSVAGCLAPYKPPRPEEPEPVPLPPPRISPSGATLQDQVSGTTQRLQAVSVVDPNIVWASGTGGTFAVTHNGGQSWRTGVVAGADSLEFRDVEAFDGHIAYLLSAGNGTQSRIYKTEDGGVNWQLQFINRDSLAFYDCFAFWDQRSGIAFSDNVRGVFPILYTDNGGADWDFLSDPSNPSASPVPAAAPGEGAFAASGTCLTTVGKEAAFIATGAGTEARILSTTDRGQTWSQVTTPIVQGTPTTGHTSVAFRNGRDGIAVGGDCMTYSIGMRAPRRGELAAELAARLADALDDETLYRDPRQAATQHPGAIPASLQRFGTAAVRKLISRPGAAKRLLGEVLSEPKPHVVFRRPRSPWRPGALALDRRTRMLYDARCVYINGESLHVGGRDAALLRRLADERGLDARRVRAASRPARSLLRVWFEAGWLGRLR